MEDSDRERTGIGQVLDLRRLSGSLGAEVRGVDLATATDEDLATILALLSEHLVLCFPDQPTWGRNSVMTKPSGVFLMCLR